MYTKNLSGLCDPAKRRVYLYNIARQHKLSPIQALFIQEHNLTNLHIKQAIADAKRHNLILIVAPLTGSMNGGAAILTPENMIGRPPGEALDTAVKRVRTSDRSAAIRYARQIKVLAASRRFSTLEGITPLEARTKYSAVIEIDQNGHWALSDSFTSALTTAEAAAKRAVDAASH
jgi:hypothetical protein